MVVSPSMFSVWQVPSPKEITDEQLQSILQSGDPTQFRVPLSLGEPHIEKDNSQKSPDGH